MSITNPDKVVTKQDLADFYDQIKSYLGSYPVAIANKFSKGDLYSTEEKMIGQWIDGKPIYQKTVQMTSPTCTTDGTEVNVTANIGATVSSVVSLIAIANTSGAWKTLDQINANVSNNKLERLYVQAYSNDNSSSDYKNKIRLINGKTTYSNLPVYVTIQYTKTTDSSTAIGNETDYSTAEKIVGTWIDGKPIYQKTIQTTLPTTSTDGTEAMNYISLNTTISEFISIKAIGMNSDKSMYFDCSTWGSITPSVLSTHIAGLTNSSSSNKNTLRLQNYKVTWNGFPVYVTIQYTKV